jgi:hypothetical protein
MEDKQLELVCELKSVADNGTFEGIASAYGIEDLDGDVIDKGAFTKTISENPTVRILWQHQQTVVIGSGEVSEWQGKIRIKGQLDMEDPDAVKAHRKMKLKLITGLSIGFQTVKSTWEEVESRMVRHIGELKLWEVSVVTFPALPMAQVTRTKSAEAERIARLESQVSALQAAAASGGSTTAEAAGKEGQGAATQTQEPDEVHSAAATFLDLLRGANS